MARKRRSSGDDGGGYSWMDTYGDLVTLVLCFFVLLFAFSTVDASKWKLLVETFTGAPPSAVISSFDPISPGELTSEAQEGLLLNNKKDKEDEQSAIDKLKEQNPELTSEQIEILSQQELELRKNFEDLFKKIKQFIIDNDYDNSLSAEKEGEKIFVVAMDGVLFDSAKATIKDEEARKLLDLMAEMFSEAQDIIGFLTIEGHTDNVPINNSSFRNNRELSSARSLTVLEYILDHSTFPETNIAHLGLGEWHPIADNSTKEGKAKNRRVTFMIERKDVVVPVTNINENN